jgi:hypothetical protein
MIFEIDRNIGDKVFIIKNGNIYKGYLYMVTFKKQIRGSLSVSDYNDYSVKENPVNSLEIVVRADTNTTIGNASNYNSFHVKNDQIYDTKREAAKALLLSAGFDCGLEEI